MNTRRNRKVKRGGANISIERFSNIVGVVIDRLEKEEHEGKNKILSAFSKLSPDDKKNVEDEFGPINASLDISKHAELGKKLYNFQKMH